MNIHEYQGRDIFRRHGSAGAARARWPTRRTEAEAIAKELGLPVMVKAQVLTGGRGKAGGVKFCATIEDVKENAGAILGMDIKGHTVRKVLVTPAVEIAEEFYLGMLVDRRSGRVHVMASAEGGVEIEQVAAETPELIHHLDVDPRFGLLDHQALGLGLKLCPGELKKARQIGAALQKLYVAFLAADASLAEINPFIFTPDGRGLAIDAKINLDDNALFRHPDYEELRDRLAEDRSPSAWRARPTSASSSWRATWAAWSTAPAWPWPPWTWSSTTAASRPTSWTSAAAPTRRRSSTP